MPGRELRDLGQNAFAARLPSLVATAATACLLYTWGVRLGSAAIGLGAAVSYAFCLQTVQQGRVATADALLIFFMTLTAFAGWQSIRPKNEGMRCHAACYGVLALAVAGGFMAKGPEALLPLAPLLWCARGEGRAVLLRITASFMIGLALVSFWAIPALIQSHGDYLKVGLGHDVWDRMAGGDFQGHGTSSVGFYLATLPLYAVLFWVSALPWSALIVLYWRRLFTSWKIDVADLYLILNAALIFIIFSLMTTKLPHYTLPAFPFLALLFARRWKSAGLSSGTPIELGVVAGGLFALFAVVLIPLGLTNHATPSPIGELVRDAGANLKPDTQFALVDFQEPNAIWEMRSVVTSYGQLVGDEEAVSFLKEQGPRAIILSSDLWRRFHILPGATDPTWKIYSARGFNAAKGEFINLTLVVKP